MRVRPVSPETLVVELADRLAQWPLGGRPVGGRPGDGRPGDGRPGDGQPGGGQPVDGLAGRGWLRVAVDGAPAAGPGPFADALVDPLQVRGRPAVRVASEDFLRPASLRYETGRVNPDAFYAGWLDGAGLRREVLEPAAPGGSGRILTSLWNAATDRASRAPYVGLAPDSVVLVSGALLLGAGLPFDVSVHLQMSAPALRRRMPAELSWTLPAYDRYVDEVDPASLADVVVRLDDPRHPALVGDPS